jgi:hypothetical protein
MAQCGAAHRHRQYGVGGVRLQPDQPERQRNPLRDTLPALRVRFVLLQRERSRDDRQQQP